jgi:hypothetical protein
VNNQVFAEYTSDKKVCRLYKLLSIKGNQIKLYFDLSLGKYFTIEYYPIVEGIQQNYVFVTSGMNNDLLCAVVVNDYYEYFYIDNNRRSILRGRPYLHDRKYSSHKLYYLDGKIDRYDVPTNVLEYNSNGNIKIKCIYTTEIIDSLTLFVPSQNANRQIAAR